MKDNFENGIYTEEIDGEVTVCNLDKYSYRALLASLPENIHDCYSRLREKLLSIKGILGRIYVGKEIFLINTDIIAKFNIDGGLYIYIRLFPDSPAGENYAALEVYGEDMLKKAFNLIDEAVRSRGKLPNA